MLELSLDQMRAISGGYRRGGDESDEDEQAYECADQHEDGGSGSDGHDSPDPDPGSNPEKIATENIEAAKQAAQDYQAAIKAEQERAQLEAKAKDAANQKLCDEMRYQAQTYIATILSSLPGGSIFGTVIGDQGIKDSAYCKQPKATPEPKFIDPLDFIK